MSDPTRQTTVDAEHAARVVSDFATAAGLAVPTTAGEVVELLDRLGYAVCPDTLREFVAKGYVSDPGGVWDAVSVYVLAAALESRRRWKVTPSPHDFKKSGARLQIEQATAAGIDPPVEGLDGYTVEDLLLQIVQSDSRAHREALYEGVRLKLAHYEE